MHGPFRTVPPRPTTWAKPKPASPSPFGSAAGHHQTNVAQEPPAPSPFASGPRPDQAPVAPPPYHDPTPVVQPPYPASVQTLVVPPPAPSVAQSESSLGLGGLSTYSGAVDLDAFGSQTDAASMTPVHSPRTSSPAPSVRTEDLETVYDFPGGIFAPVDGDLPPVQRAAASAQRMNRWRHARAAHRTTPVDHLAPVHEVILYLI